MDIALARKRRKWPYFGGLGLVVAIGASLLGVGWLDAAAPKVSRSAIWIDGVKRGTFVREVSAPGSLVSDDVRIVTARASGTVDRVLVKAGIEVEPDTLLLELNNPDLEFSALEAATEVKAAQAELLDVQASLGIQRIEQRSLLERTRGEYREARRRADANAPLAAQQVISPLDAQQLRERASELEQRVKFEEEQVSVLEAGGDARAAAQRARVEGLRAQAALRATQVAELEVHAGTKGLLAELGVEVGQRVDLGAVLGKIIDPRRLRAELRVPEDQAADVAVGQRVAVSIQDKPAVGRVTRIEPGVQAGAVRVEVSFEGALPEGARLDLSVDGRIELSRVENAVYTGKPVGSAEQTTLNLFKLRADGREAARVPVRIGRTSVTAVEVLSGLAPGDRVILSDMSEWNHVDRIELE